MLRLWMEMETYLHLDLVGFVLSVSNLFLEALAAEC